MFPSNDSDTNLCPKKAEMSSSHGSVHILQTETGSKIKGSLIADLLLIKHPPPPQNPHLHPLPPPPPPITGFEAG